ncbi:MAG: acetyl-CoA carboxylase biotin carboxyl carrier protein [Chlorobiaceae bacterium]|nr:acetyl-CoA carboxylase biotin carboxyl carrier protein [Chlorobiaceae bacterium]NTW75161.1 acetyl-CoA carboxylase biotin carboxyl carrier protein [Chlorobiaceae bacterium]
MNLKEIQHLVEIINASNLDEVIIKEGESEITLRRNSSKAQTIFQPAPAVQPVQRAAAPEQPVAAPAAAPAEDLLEIRSPIVGTFYSAPSPDSPAFVKNGDRVKPGDVLCIIEAMKLMNEIESEVSGAIVDVLVENGQPVEYNQVLFRVKP